MTISKREERAAMLHERFWARVEKASETPEKSASAARAHLEQCPNRPTDHSVSGTCDECHLASCVLGHVGGRLPPGPTEPSAAEAKALREARGALRRP